MGLSLETAISRERGQHSPVAPHWPSVRCNPRDSAQLEWTDILAGGLLSEDLTPLTVKDTWYAAKRSATDGFS
eukprot:562125-Pelagomonas_calceolata.AAC.2